MNKIYILPINTNSYSFVKNRASKKYNIDINSLEIKRNEHGKPFFENLPDFHFNISHSGELLAIAISNAPVGVDIQKERPFNESVIKRFHPDEINYISSKNQFFEIWTQKEACLKYLGTGISGGLNKYSVLNFSPKPKTYKHGEYFISVCGHFEFEIIK